MSSLRLTIDLDQIEANSRQIVALCRAHGIEVTGVTKGTCGHPEVAKAMLRGGVSSIGDSRMENLRRIQAAGADASYMLVRIPPLSGADEVVTLADVSLHSELSVVTALSASAQEHGRLHEVILMVELGDLREGLPLRDVIPFVRETLRLPAVRIRGLGANLGCLGGGACQTRRI